MAKIVLNKPTSGYNLAAINDNFVKIEAELQNKVAYRDNPVGEPNAQITDIDMNGKRIYNLAPGVSPNDAVTVAQGLGNVAAVNAAAASAEASATTALDAQFQARAHRDSANSSAITAANEADEAGTAAGNAATSATAAASSATSAANSANAALAGSAAVTLVSNSTTVGAINLDNPGGATRSFTQWNGTAYAGFTLGAVAFQSSLFDLNSTGAKITSNSEDTVLFGDSSGGYLQYVKGSATWNMAIGGVFKLTVNSALVSIKQKTLIQFDTTTPDYNTGHLALKTNNGSDASMGFHREGSTACQLRHSGNGLILSGTSRTDPANLLVLGKILQAGVTDDGVTALQTTSYSASNQPGLIGSGNLMSFTAPTTLVINTSVLKGGVTLQGGQTGIVAPVAGTYMLLASVFCNAPVLTANPYFEIFKNGFLLVKQGAIQIASTSTPHSLSVVLAVAMLPGDYVSVRIATPNSVPLEARFDSVSFTKLN